MENKNPEVCKDMLDLDTTYAITINPNDEHQYFGDRDNRLEKVCTYMQNFHLTKIANMEYILYPEISTPSGAVKGQCTRIHFHGVIKFTTYESLSKWYITAYNRLVKVAMVKVKPIDNIDKWTKYYQKNNVVMSALCKLARINEFLSDTQGRWDRLVFDVIENEHIIKNNDITIARSNRKRRPKK